MPRARPAGWMTGGACPRSALALLAVASVLLACPTESEPEPQPEPPCPDGQHAEGEACIPDVCGVGPWGAIDRSGAVVHVAPWGTADGDGSEAAPVHTVARGLELAADGAAELVALELGTYAERFAFSRIENAPRIEGRCPEGVVLASPEHEFPVVSALDSDVTVRGLTLRGGAPGVFAGRTAGGLPSYVLLADVVVEEAGGHGVMASGEGVLIGLEYVTVASAVALPSGNLGRGVGVENGARISAVGLEVQRADDVAAWAGGIDSQLDLLGSWIQGGARGGILIEDGARLEADRLVVEANSGVGLHVTGPGSGADLLDSEIRQTLRAGDDPASGVGVLVDAQAGVSGTRLGIADSQGPGAIAAFGATFACEECALIGNGLVGAAALDGGIVRLDGGQVSTSAATDEQPGGGVGLFAWNVSAAPTLEIEEVTLAGHAGPAIYLRGHGRYSIASCDLDDSGTGAGVAAMLVGLDGVGQWGGGAGLLVAASTFTHVPLDGMVLHASTATLQGTTFESGGGFDVYQQACDGVLPPEDDTGDVVHNQCQGEPRVIEPRITVEVP